MFIIYSLVFILAILVIHLFFLPLSKRRPIFIKGFEGSFFSVILFAVIAIFIHPFFYFIAVAIGLLIYYTKSWIVYGVSLEKLNSALNKAILATRAESSSYKNTHEIDNNMTVKLINLGVRVCLIQYKNKTFSKKSELTKEIFRKFIQNYYL